ncbi:Fe(3+)-citrate import system permease protein YfmE OS=Streptomyces microflavus OX=1919 GN=yfmE PE=3 SV=1 [Streptomyces microflavus]
MRRRTTAATGRTAMTGHGAEAGRTSVTGRAAGAGRTAVRRLPVAPVCLTVAAVVSAVCALSLGTPYVPPGKLLATLGSDGLAGLVVTELRADAVAQLLCPAAWVPRSTRTG